MKYVKALPTEAVVRLSDYTGSCSKILVCVDADSPDVLIGDEHSQSTVLAAGDKVWFPYDIDLCINVPESGIVSIMGF